MLLLPKQENFKLTHTNTSKSHIIYLQKDARECMIEHAYVPKISNHMNSSVCLFCCSCLFGIYGKYRRRKKKLRCVLSVSVSTFVADVIIVFVVICMILVFCRFTSLLRFLVTKQTNKRKTTTSTAETN